MMNNQDIKNVIRQIGNDKDDWRYFENLTLITNQVDDYVDVTLYYAPGDNMFPTHRKELNQMRDITIFKTELLAFREQFDE